jgi:hypothetical protein
MTTEPARDTGPDAGPEPLDSALLQAIRPSAARMAAAEDTFVQLLVEDIGSLVRDLPDSGWQLCERTARTVLWLALSDQPADVAIQSLHWLGEANQADGFPSSEYVTVGHALVRIAREVSGLNWTTTTGSAWIRFFMWLRPHLQAGAQQQAARQEAAREEAAAGHDAAYHPASDQAARPAAADVDAVTVADLLNEEGTPAAARDQAVPGVSARDQDE